MLASVEKISMSTTDLEPKSIKWGIKSCLLTKSLESAQVFDNRGSAKRHIHQLRRYCKDHMKHIQSIHPYPVDEIIVARVMTE